MSRPFYFGAGPAQLPEEVLCGIQSELLNWHHSGLSILEIGHRTVLFEEVMVELEACLRDLLSVPAHYQILFMGCPVRAHFGLIPLHFLSAHQQAGYWLTGHWSELAYKEAVKLKQAYCIARSTSSGKKGLLIERDEFQDNTGFVYFTPNETIDGVRFYPAMEDIAFPVIADMTSCLLTESIRVEDYALILAGTQKNLGMAGLSVVIINERFMDKIQTNNLPTYLDYRTYARTHSLAVTPPTFNCEIMLKMLKWMKAQGGLAAISTANIKKADTLYEYIDSTDFYRNEVESRARSRVNVTFHLQDKSLEPLFIKEAKAHHLLGLEGHRSVGGLRASLYNAMPYEGVIHLIKFMKGFETKHT